MNAWKSTACAILVGVVALGVSGCSESEELAGLSVEGESEVSISTFSLKEGEHFRDLGEQVEGLTADVTRFYWFGCPHCNALRGPFDEWLSANPMIKTENVHSVISRGWVKDAILAGVLGDHNYPKAAFDAVYDFRNAPADSSSDVVDILNRAGVEGVDSDHFDLSKDEIADHVSRINETKSMEKRIGAAGVPYLVVKGRYLVLNSGFSSYREMLKGTKWLIDNK